MGNLYTGLNFMVIGMTVVFLFLVLLVGAMYLLRFIVVQINKIMPEAEVQLAPVKAEGNSQEIAAVIAAAYSMKN